MILGALGKILGSESVIKKGMDLIDDMHTSETESIEAKTQAKVALMNSYAPFKVAQRYLALMFGLTYVLCFIIVLAMTLTGKGDPSAVSQVMEQFQINYAMLLILGFYFGGGAIESFTSRNKKNDQIR